MSGRCAACGDALGNVGFECTDCGEVHCRSHRSDHPGCRDPEYDPVTPDPVEDGSDSSATPDVDAGALVDGLEDVRVCSTCGDDLRRVAYGCEGCGEVYCREDALEHDECPPGDNYLVKFDPADPTDPTLFEVKPEVETGLLGGILAPGIVVVGWLVVVPAIFPGVLEWGAYWGGTTGLLVWIVVEIAR